MTPPARTATVAQPARQITILSKIGEYLAPVLIMMADYVVVVASLLIAAYFRGEFLTYYFSSLSPFYINSTYIYFLVPLTYLVFLAYEGMYTKRQPFWQSVESLFKICIYVSIVAIGIMYFAKHGDISRIFIITMWLLSFVNLTIAYYGIKRILVSLGLWEKPVVLVGAGKTAEILAKTFAEETNLGYKIIGLVEDNYTERPLIHKYPHIGDFAHAEQAIIASGAQDVVLATPGIEREELVNLVYRIQPYIKNLTIVPDLFGVPLNNMNVETLFNEKTVLLKIRNNLASKRNYVLKKLFDIFLGLIITVAILPIMLLVAFMIKITSPGPIMYVANRLGKNGQNFLCYKFRTMYVNADNMLNSYFKENPAARDEWEKYAKLREYDPRVTIVGRWLRKYSLDELPQIFNVLKGDMSLVGPRPYLPRERERMKYYADVIFETVPGVTGLWQVSGRNDIDFDGRLRLDSWYVHNWSIWLDIVLLLKTLKVVLGRKGAY